MTTVTIPGDGDPPVVGAILTGGSSRRMGQDKALLEVHGRTLVAIGADALRGAGAGPVLAVGGDPEALGAASPGLEPVADDSPGQGPLGGLLTAFRHAVVVTGRPDVLVVVIACDMPAIDAPTIRALVDALRTEPRAGVATAVVDGRPQPLTAAWRPLRADPVLRAAFAAGERAPRRLLPDLVVVPVLGLAARALGDVDRPEDLAAHGVAVPKRSDTVPGGRATPAQDPETTR